MKKIKEVQKQAAEFQPGDILFRDRREPSQNISISSVVYILLSEKIDERRSIKTVLRIMHGQPYIFDIEEDIFFHAHLQKYVAQKEKS